jgi:UDP-N-acetyl-D-glucosamine dehydrogenase
MRHYRVPDLQSAELTLEWLSSQDAVLIVTDHSAVDYEFVVKHSRLVIDTRNATRGVNGADDKVRRA